MPAPPPYALPKARPIETFTDTNAVTNASTIQVAADSIPPCNNDGPNNDGPKDALGEAESARGTDNVPACAVTSTTTIATSTAPATTKPGKTRFQGNGIGGGATASRRTASITETTKPEEGRISFSRKSMRSISSSPLAPFITPPSNAAQPATAEVCRAKSPVPETTAP